MSDTIRVIPHQHCFRRPRTHSIRVMEIKAADALRDEGFGLSNRLRHRSSPTSNEETLPSAWDDLHIAGYAEMKKRMGR
jgi:hypothetical protein